MASIIPYHVVSVKRQKRTDSGNFAPSVFRRRAKSRIEFLARPLRFAFHRAPPTGRCSCGAATSSFPTAKNPGSLIYASRIRVRMRGSRWVQAQPAGSTWVQALPESAAPTRDFQKTSGNPQTSAALINGGRQSSPEPAAAGGCRLSLPAARGCGLSLPGGLDLRGGSWYDIGENTDKKRQQEDI